MNGIINVYKEKGYTSFDVVAKMRGIFKQKKIGHTGTLDPEAEGVLPVCLGNATKVCELLTDKDKEYEAVLLLGVTTDTEDLTGEVLSRAPVTCTETEIRDAIQSFEGAYAQVPPMYSALKVNGQKLCDLARKGVSVERKPRNVTIFKITVDNIKIPEITIKVHCSKGTYIRTLCKDIGEKLGCGGCMKSLVRTRVAGFELSESHPLKDLEENFSEDWLISVDTLFPDCPRLYVKEEAMKLALNGNRLPQSALEFPDTGDSFSDVSKIRIYTGEGTFLGIYEQQSEAADYKPVKLFL